MNRTGPLLLFASGFVAQFQRCNHFPDETINGRYKPASGIPLLVKDHQVRSGVRGVCEVPGTHLPVVGDRREQVAQRDAGAGAGGDPGVRIAAIVIGRIQAIFITGGTLAGPPTQAGIGRHTGSAIYRRDLLKWTRGGHQGWLSPIYPHSW